MKEVTFTKDFAQYKAGQTATVSEEVYAYCVARDLIAVETPPEPEAKPNPKRKKS